MLQHDTSTRCTVHLCNISTISLLCFIFVCDQADQHPHVIMSWNVSTTTVLCATCIYKETRHVDQNHCVMIAVCTGIIALTDNKNFSCVYSESHLYGLLTGTEMYHPSFHQQIVRLSTLLTK